MLYLVLLLSSESVQRRRTIYLIPNESSVRECSTQECHTLTSLTGINLVEENVLDITITLLPGVHTYRGTKEGIFEISDVTTVELRSDDLKVGATVSCNTTKRIGFAFNNVSDIKIRSITFGSCGIRQVGVKDYFTLSISHSDNVTIENLIIKNATGIALQVEHLNQVLILKNSTFFHNQANLYIFNNNPENKTFTENKHIIIKNSQFFSGHYAGRSNHSLLKVTNPGITMVLNQTVSHFELSLENISIYVYPKDKFSNGFCDIYHNMHTTQIHINGLECNTEYVKAVYDSLYGYRHIPGLSIEPRSFSTEPQKGSIFGSITINNAYFNNSRMQIGPLWRSDEKFKLTMTNISIRHALDPLTIVNIGYVMLHNVTIQDSNGALCITKC